MATGAKIAQSVLVVIHTAALQVLLLHRSDAPGFWQSVTGSKDHVNESWHATAVREVWEETGLECSLDGSLGHTLRDWRLENVYEIYPQWRHRYPPGVTHNTEHVFGLQLPAASAVRLNPREHTEQVWLPFLEAADRCFSPSNAEAILCLPRMLPQSPR